MIDRIKDMWYLLRHLVAGYHNWKPTGYYINEFQCSVCKTRITKTLNFILPRKSYHETS